MEGRQISDSQWQQIEGFLPGRPDSVGVTARDNRLFVDGVLWVLRSGPEWKDLPEEYGKWKTSRPASSIIADLASTIFAGSPPLHGLAAGRHRYGSWASQIPG